MSTCPDPAPLDAGTLSRLWMLVAGAYGAKWTSFAGELPIDRDGNLTAIARMWAADLAGFTREQVMAGFDRWRKTAAQWPPSLPEMVCACHGIPTLNIVRGQLTRPDPAAAPFIRMLWQHLDSWRFSRADQRDADQMVREAYEQAVRRVMRGEKPPEDAPRIERAPPPPYRPAAPETIQAVTAKVHELLGAPPPPIQVPPQGLSPTELEQYEQDLIASKRDGKAAAAGDA